MKEHTSAAVASTGSAQGTSTGSAQRSPREQLLTDGFCKFSQILDGAMLAELRTVTDGLLAQATADHRQLYKYQGSNIYIAYQHGVFARLFAYPAALGALKQLGFAAPKWRSAYLLSKPPKAPQLYWHQDWAAWEDPCSANETPPQIFLMYYLTDTNRENGCLRVIPGTHRRRIDLHDYLPTAHSKDSYEANVNSILFQDHPEAVDVPVRAGDVLIGDARVLHAAYANTTDHTRTCLTLWYIPDFDSLSEPVQAWAARKEPLAPPHWWTGEAGRMMEPLIPWYHGTAQPGKFTRTPGKYLGR